MATKKWADIRREHFNPERLKANEIKAKEEILKYIRPKNTNSAEYFHPDCPCTNCMTFFKL
jgi:hypothetical protein